jgi:hydroxyacylglutathione hydrolase
MQIRSFSVNAFQVNCYVLYHQGEALIVDPGGPAETVLAFLEEKKLKVVAIGNTHGHADHIAGNAWFRDKTGAPLFIHELDAPYLADPALHLGAQLGRCCVPAAPLRSGGDSPHRGRNGRGRRGLGRNFSQDGCRRSCGRSQLPPNHSPGRLELE